jgi:hypothetical protein
MYRKYDDLADKEPKKCAEIVGKVRKENYLAHTIREIEYAIRRLKGSGFAILTFRGESKISKISFFSKGCEIRLPRECDELDDKVIRLTLAHELGHLVFNFDKLDNPEQLNILKTSDAEEKFAWIFAYYLIIEKSKMYSNTHAYQKFVYREGELKSTVRSLIDKKTDTIKSAVIKELNLPNI